MLNLLNSRNNELKQRLVELEIAAAEVGTTTIFVLLVLETVVSDASHIIKLIASLLL